MASDKVISDSTMTFSEFAIRYGCTYLWVCGVGCPAGLDFTADPESEDYAGELSEQVPYLDQIEELTGTIDEHGRWAWDGEGDPRDERGNTIYNIKAGWAK